MSEIDQRFGQVGDDALGATIAAWRHGFVERSDLCDAHLASCAACTTTATAAVCGGRLYMRPDLTALFSYIRHWEKQTRPQLVARAATAPTHAAMCGGFARSLIRNTSLPCRGMCQTN